MNRRHFWIGLLVIVGGCVAVAAVNADNPEDGTVEACQQFRVAIDNPPTDTAMANLLLDLSELDTSASVHSAAINLADQLEQGSSADVHEAVDRMDAACSASDL